MTFFATLLFGAGALLLISALENTSLTTTLGSILSGDLTVQSPAASSTTTSGNSPLLPLTGTPAQTPTGIQTL